MIRVRRGLSALAVVFALGSALAGCVGSTPAKSPTPSTKPTPLYSSDSEALVAAKDSYQQYVNASNEVAHSGWVNLDPFKRVVTGDALTAETKAAMQNREKEIHTTGDASGSVIRIQKITATSVTAYACFDVAATRVINSSGQDVTSPNRTDIVPFQVEFVKRQSGLMLERSDVWSGDTFC